MEFHISFRLSGPMTDTLRLIIIIYNFFSCHILFIYEFIILFALCGRYERVEYVFSTYYGGNIDEIYKVIYFFQEV